MSGWNYKEWGLFPYGSHLCWVIPLLTFLGTCFFVFPAFRCSLTVNKGDDFSIWYGYWKIENADIAMALGPSNDSNSCGKWSSEAKDEFFDGAWKFGKAVGVMGVFTTIPAFIFDCLLIFRRYELNWFYPLIGVHVLNAFFDFMLLIGLASKVCDITSCALSRGGYVAVLGGLLWLTAAVLLFLLRKKEEEMTPHPKGVDLTDLEKEKALLALPPSETPHHDVEAPLALPAPPEHDSDEIEKKKPSRPKRKKKAEDEKVLVLPPSETIAATDSPKKKPSSSKKPKPKKKKAPKPEEAPENDEKKKKKPPKKKKSQKSKENDTAEEKDTTNPKKKKKKKKPKSDPTMDDQNE